MCGFSSQVVQILGYLGVPYKGVNVLEDEGIRQGIKEFSNWPTIPQLYVKGEFIGGCDIVRRNVPVGRTRRPHGRGRGAGQAARERLKQPFAPRRLGP